MSTQHTPGPWAFAYANDVGPDDDYFIEFFEVLTRDCTVLARVEKESDARLIGAAPDLLDALQDAYEILGISYPLTEPDSDKRGVVLSKARAALLKAKGESND
jgi:hypothetical protein